ncbi:MAG: putative toxin-antitoxin system toxin component, PIN family [Desulfuromonadaceae bacterium]|nr:putative toxin-antitoxin system toxin component, PIN family [Desulfuromonadaceae bacterium]MDD5104020.1 putative toxin-antitoxin system toxin component, PIN family [Desulfuromonadaceae bacterium]
MGENITRVRVVLDTNVLVSALLFGGKVGMLRDLWKSGRIIPLISKETFAEFRKVLSYPKFKLSQREIRAILNDEILPFVEALEITEQVTGICRDQHDDIFLAVAARGGAGHLVTGDQDLLVLINYAETRIVTVAEFLSLVGDN